MSVFTLVTPFPAKSNTAPFNKSSNLLSFKPSNQLVFLAGGNGQNNISHTYNTGPQKNLSRVSNQQIIPTPTPTASIDTPTSTINLLEFTKGKIEAFIRVPAGLVPTPYVILSGYQAITGDSGEVSLMGSVGTRKFFCPSSPCALDFPETGVITFHAQNAKGDVSEELTASIFVTQLVDGYSITVTSLGKFVIFSDSCSSIFQNADSSQTSWSRFPQDPAELNTEKTLYFLAAKLLKSGIVNTTDCPGGGWDAYGSPNACGISRIKDQMISWQNQYDMNIWLVSRDEHIPPIILKTLFEIESQFWPVSQRLFLDELGLGQINQLGIDVLLRSDPSIYNKVCSNALYKCNLPYENLPGIDRALIRGTVAQSLDATCPTCTFGFDLSKTAQSIPLVAKVLYANCVQAKSILNLFQVKANYEDSWKFTLVSYHSGFGCLRDAISKSAVPGNVVTWKNTLPYLKCQSSSEYVDKFWSSLQGFNKSQKQPGELPHVQLNYSTPVPKPEPTLAYSKSRIVVKIFLDKNGDGIQQGDESLDNVQVNLDFDNGIKLTQYSKNGSALFDLRNIIIGTKGKISLPGLYRNASILVPESGDIPIIFIFSSPILPTKKP